MVVNVFTRTASPLQFRTLLKDSLQESLTTRYSEMVRLAVNTALLQLQQLHPDVLLNQQEYKRKLVERKNIPAVASSIGQILQLSSNNAFRLKSLSLLHEGPPPKAESNSTSSHSSHLQPSLWTTQDEQEQQEQAVKLVSNRCIHPSTPYNIRT